jgi:hypothetical protein
LSSVTAEKGVTAVKATPLAGPGTGTVKVRVSGPGRLSLREGAGYIPVRPAVHRLYTGLWNIEQGPYVRLVVSEC